MFDFHLPMAEEFEKIFLENEVYEWEAKHFWQKIDQTVLVNPEYEKSFMYSGLKILRIRGYLISQPTFNNKRLFLYTATKKLKALKNSNQNSDLKSIFFEERSNLIKNLEVYDFQISFISELIPKYPHLNIEIFKIKKTLNLNRKKYEEKINAIDHFLKII